MSHRVLIVGLGQIGMQYDLYDDLDGRVCSHARAFHLHPEFHIIAGVDINTNTHKPFTQEYGAPAYADVVSAIAEHTPDLVVIAVPTFHHGLVLKSVLKQTRPKAILCEKPIAESVVISQEMVDTCKAENVLLFVNYVRRADQGVIEIKERIDAGEIVTPLKGVAWYTKGFLHNGSHFIDLLQYWLGPLQHAKVIDQERSHASVGADPDVSATFEHGSVTFMAAWEEAYSHATIELVSPSGRLRYERGGENITWQSTQSDPNFQDYTMLSPTADVIVAGMSQYQWHVTDQLVLAMDGRACTLCCGSEAHALLAKIKDILGEHSS